MNHKEKMQSKKIARERLYRKMTETVYIPCNLGVNHPDYGMSWEDHQSAKAQRG